MSKTTLNKILKLIIISLLVMNAHAYGQDRQISDIDSVNTHRILTQLEKGLPIGRIRIYQDERVDALLRKHISYNDSVGVQGWKILIYHGRERKRAQDAGAQFNSEFPDIDMPTLVDYQAPDFKTLVGAFRTKEEAYCLHQQIKVEFELSYLVPATINPGEMK